MERLQGHFYNITKNNKDDPIGRHFNQSDHNGINDVKINIVEFIHSHPESELSISLRNTIEKNWIHRLRTPAPHGLNSMD